MAGKNTAVFGIYDSKLHAERAIDALKAAGFRNTDISCLLPENLGSKDLAPSKETKAPEGAATGTSAGAIVGGTLGWLVGAGALFIPGVGPFIAAGPIMAALAGAGVGGALGGVTGALVGVGIPEYVAKRYTGLTKEGKVLLSVHCDSSDWISKAKRVLEETDASDIGSANESSTNTVEGSKSDRPYDREMTLDDRPLTSDHSLAREASLRDPLLSDRPLDRTTTAGRPLDPMPLADQRNLNDGMDQRI